jgi:DNA-directed RNA polymerase subunit F
MEVVRNTEAVLSNFEVMTFLREQKQIRLGNRTRTPGGTGAKDRSGAVTTLVFETLSAIEKTPALNQDEAKIIEFLDRLEKFRLTRTESLMLLNHCPASAVEVHLLIEESEERLSEDNVQEILDIVQEIFGKAEEDVVEEEAAPPEEPDKEPKRKGRSQK